jgi:internalin A
MTNLMKLSISAVNSVSDFVPLASLANLSSRELDRCAISANDLTPISGLTELKWLSLAGNEISNVNVLSGLTNLTYLELGENEIAEVASLSEITDLVELYFYGNRIFDAAPLAGLTNLKELNLKSNPIPLAQKETLKQVLTNCYMIFQVDLILAVEYCFV